MEKKSSFQKTSLVILKDYQVHYQEGVWEAMEIKKERRMVRHICLE